MGYKHAIHIFQPMLSLHYMEPMHGHQGNYTGKSFRGHRYRSDRKSESPQFRWRACRPPSPTSFSTKQLPLCLLSSPPPPPLLRGLLLACVRHHLQSLISAQQQSTTNLEREKHKHTNTSKKKGKIKGMKCNLDRKRDKMIDQESSGGLKLPLESNIPSEGLGFEASAGAGAGGEVGIYRGVSFHVSRRELP
ncbi:hypothetical protein E2542_SST30559 [Spatholobus suberectus]|nr:hypothetical protein E2542_SST30559 [Spatholobus suberectus]